uniref:Zinc finger, RAN-binding domain containing 3 n=1 Tax=Salarias fasciatus TaxID=181472 RepID=A0A672FH77_SALFA
MENVGDDGGGGPPASCGETRWSRQLSGLPPRLLRRLMPFQREGVEFALSRDGRCMIADEMGLGKTVQAIAVACAYRADWPLLVVVPSSLRYPWVEELERWVPELQPGDVHLVDGKSDTMRIGSSKVTVLGYGLLTTDARPLVDALSRQRFAVVVVDEAHYLKSRNAARTKILVPLVQGAKRAVLLTGTPALGRPEELFMQLDALHPRRFGTWGEYTKKYCNAHFRYFGSRRQWDCRGASNLEDLHRRLSQVMIRRLKADVLTQLPPKIRQRIPFDLPKEAAKEAAASFAEWERLMRSGVGDATEVMGLVTRMYKQTAIAKAGAVKDYMKLLLETERLKFLVFAHHLSMLQACTEAAVEAQASYIRIDGSVPSSERIQLVHKFQSDPETRVAILSIQAAGQGLTFTAASHVVFAELYWNPGHLKQAEDRAHRIGQANAVNVHYLIAKGTFDGAMWAMLNRKVNVTGSTLNGRRGKLDAAVGDGEEWEFLSLAEAWTPGETPLPDDESKMADVFFTHHEKEKQHDIRSFFSPSAKRTRSKEDEETSPSPGTTVSPDRDFSPQVKRFRKPRPSPGSRLTLTPRRRPRPDPVSSTWSCGACTYSNSGLLPYCEMCEGPRTTDLTFLHSPDRQDDDANAGGGGAEEDDSDSATWPLHPGLQFCPSQYTDRIYLYSEDGTPLNLSFVPLDVQLSNWDDLPEAFSRRPEHRTQVLRFVREWSGLSAMKQRLLRRGGMVFGSPGAGLQQLAAAQRPHSSTKRYLSREDVSQASLDRARRDGGGVRLVATATRYFSSPSSSLLVIPSLRSDGKDPGSPGSSGYLQALDAQGIPLCLSCQQPCPTPTPTPTPTPGTAGDARFCSPRCQEELRLRSSQAFLRSRVLEAERGVCQHCGLDAHALFLQVRDAPPPLRKEILESSWLAQLSLKQLNQMIRAPVEGDFWQADHIRPVYGGGGQCSLDNLQTLCTVCHKSVQYYIITQQLFCLLC